MALLSVAYEADDENDAGAASEEALDYLREASWLDSPRIVSVDLIDESNTEKPVA
jgi:hypothetical protein